MWATYLGGTSDEYPKAMELDGSGNVYITTQTTSNDYPTTVGAYDETYAGLFEIGVSKLSSDGTTLDWSTYVGGTGSELPADLVLDGSNNVYVVGHCSSNPVITGGVYQTAIAGSNDGYVFKLSSDGSKLDWATLIGGTGNDQSSGIALDGSNNVYICGYTGSTDYPGTTGSYQASLSAVNDAFIAKLSSDGTTLSWASYLGGGWVEDAKAIRVDASNQPVIVGYTGSNPFPTTSGAYQETSGGDYDVFVTKFSSDGTSLIFSTYIGGANTDYGYAMDMNSNGEVLL